MQKAITIRGDNLTELNDMLGGGWTIIEICPFSEPAGKQSSTTSASQILVILETKKGKKKDPLKPEPRLLVKIGSIVVHADETLSPDGRNLDKDITLRLINDPEVQEWIKQMGALLPHRRIGKDGKPQ